MYGYKKAWSNKGPVIVKLEIDPATAFMVVDIAHQRMRVNQCKVVDILNLDGTTANVDFAASYYDPSFIYCVDGRTMTMEKFDFSSRSQYARGVHCYTSFEHAAKYNVSIRRFTWPLWKLKSWVFYNFCY